MNTFVKEKKCKMKGCKRPYRAKGYCNVHYKKWRRGELGKSRYKTCSEEGCKGKAHRWGYCETHYNSHLQKNQDNAGTGSKS